MAICYFNRTPYELSPVHLPFGQLMSKQKYLLYVCGLLLLVLVTTMLVLFSLNKFYMQPGIKPENFKRLAYGMSATQVEAILGRKSNFQSMRLPSEFCQSTWICQGCKIVIEYKIDRCGRKIVNDGYLVAGKTTQLLDKDRSSVIETVIHLVTGK